MGQGFEVETDALRSVAGQIKGQATTAGGLAQTAGSIEVDALSWGLMFNFSLHPVYDRFKARAAENLQSLQTLIEKGMDGLEKTAVAYETGDKQVADALTSIAGGR